jgi:hypothetical protein
MVSVVASSVVDRVFEPQSGKTEENKIGICCLTVTSKYKIDCMYFNFWGYLNFLFLIPQKGTGDGGVDN